MAVAVILLGPLGSGVAGTLFSQKNPQSTGFIPRDGASMAAFDSSGNLLAISGTDWVEVWDVPSRRKILSRSFPGGNAAILSFSQPGKLQIWGAQSTTLNLKTGHLTPMSSDLPWAPMYEVKEKVGHHLIMEGDNGFYIEDLKSHQKRKIQPSSGDPKPIFLPGKNAIAMAGEKSMSIVNADNLQKITSVSPPMQEYERFVSMTGTPEGRTIVGLTTEGAFYVWKPSSGIKVIRTRDVRRDGWPVSASINIAPDGQSVVALTGEHFVRLDLTDFSISSGLAPLPNNMPGVLYAPKGGFFVSGSCYGVTLFDSKTLRIVAEFGTH